MNDDMIGPALPPGFLGSQASGSSSCHSHSNSEGMRNETGPSRSRRHKPASSSGTDDSESDSSASSHSSASDSDSDESSRNTQHSNSSKNCEQTDGSHEANQQRTIGPQVPAGFLSGKVDSLKQENHSSKECIGPVLPPGFPVKEADNLGSGIAGECRSAGPALPPGFQAIQHHSSDEEDLGFGPRLPLPGNEKTAVEEFEERSRLMKHRLLHGDEADSTPQRETWMTELPSVGIRKHMGLQARKLGSGSTVKYEDQSVWTDTPEDRLRKQQDILEGKQSTKRPLDEPVQSARDKVLSEQVEQHNKKKRAESLLDMHMKKLQKKKKKEEKKKEEKRKKEKKKRKKNKTDKLSAPVSSKPERKAFNREEDLNVNRFDNAQRKSLIKRSQELNTKFSAGGKQFL